MNISDWQHEKAYFSSHFKLYTHQIKGTYLYVITFLLLLRGQIFNQSCLTLLTAEEVWVCCWDMPATYSKKHWFLVCFRLFLPRPRPCNRSIAPYRYGLCVLSWLLRGRLLFWIIPFCVTFTLFHVCLCCLHVNFLPASMLCKALSVVQMTRILAVKTVQHNKINDGA